ncbi:MAG: SpoIID/LytB domain-containing protein, partial [Calditrichaeota bacterium]
PLLRVGLLQHQNQVYFMVGGPFSIFRKDGKFIVRVLKGHRWRADIIDIKPAVIEYRLRYWMTSDHKLAFEKSHELAEKNLRPEILQFAAGNARWKLTRLRKMIYHVVLWRIFDTREAAEAMQKQLAAKVHLEVMPVTKVPAGGTIEITNLESGKRWRFPSGSRIVTDRFALLNVPVGEGFHWENRRDEVFRGNLELLIDQEKKLTAVDELPLESYLRGVVPSEMHANFPLEALKAQAIAARSQVLVNAGRKHLDEDFDVCATVHCQVYSGMMKEAKSTDRAIKETAGLVLFSQSQIVEGVYSGVCGGQTENNENVWNGNPMPHLRGVFDGEGPPGLLDNYLQDEARLRRWIAKRPPVFCNNLEAQVPEAMVYTRKYFRWQQTETRLALSGYIRQATGENFGQLKDILPLERGVSGRLRRIR